MKRLAEELWRRGIDISLRELRKWAHPVEKAVDWADVLQLAWEEENKRAWAPIVLLNQLQKMFETEEDALRFIGAAIDNNVPLIPLVISWRAENVDPQMLLAKPMSRPKYLDAVSTPVDFFLAVYKYEHGADVEEILEKVRTTLGERYVNDFLRLVDIDMPLEPEAFVKRVEEAINVILKAREQGLDVGKILEVWDGMAEGGERLEKLADAVRAVAEEEVRKKFWEEVRNAFSELGIQVFPDEATNNLFTKAYYSELIDVNNGKVDISGLKEVIQRVAPLLKKIRPIPLYRTKEIENILERVGVGSTNPLDIISVLEKLPRLPLNVFFETELWSYVVEGIRKAKDDPNLPERLATVLRDIAEGNIERGDDVIRMLVPD